MAEIFNRRLVAFLLIIIMLASTFNITSVFAHTLPLRDESDFSLNIEWLDSEFTSGKYFSIEEDSNVSNAATMRVHYEWGKVPEEGIKAGELAIVVEDGVGESKRYGKFEAVVGADKDTDTNKKRDWSYTYNKAQNTYTFTNNTDIKGNSVLSGYFDMVWNIEARESEDNYWGANYVSAFLPDGSVREANQLFFENYTETDEFSVSVTKRDLYSYEGLTSKLDNPEKYAFYRFDFRTDETKHARGLKDYRFIFTPDYNGIGEGGIVVGSNMSVKDNNDGTYEINLPLDSSSTGEDYFVYVAFPIETYGGQTTQVDLSLQGTYYEENNSSELAYNFVELLVPTDFSFADIPGEIYTFYKDTHYDKTVSNDVTLEQGGDIAGRKLIKGTTERFYLEGSFKKSNDESKYKLELVDDFIYLTTNDGQYRQLEPGEYNFSRITIPSISGIRGMNNNAIEADKYPVKVYAFADGQKADTTSVEPVFSGTLGAQQNVNLPDDTTAVSVVIDELDVSLGSYSIPVYVDFHIDENETDNITSGQIVNTSFIKYYKDGEWQNDHYTEDTYVDMTELGLAQKDMNTYGSYLDREKDNITLYEADKSDYDAYTNLSEIVFENNRYHASYTIGGNFDFPEEVPDKFSVYTIMDKNLTLEGYDIEEDLWDVFNITGLGLDSATLIQHADIEIKDNYRDSGRTYVGVHFNLEGFEIDQTQNIRVNFPVKINKKYLSSGSKTIIAKSALIIDKDFDGFTLDKRPDDGVWSSEKELFSDIDNDNDTGELISRSSDYTTHIYAESSEFRVTKSVKTSTTDDYVNTETPLAEEGTDYTYMLTVRNGANASKNISITDILETGESAKWQGQFKSIDISEAEEIGLSGEIRYSESDKPSENDWKSTLAKDKVRAVAVDFDGTLGVGRELNIYVTMTAPYGMKDEVTENGFAVDYTMVDAASGNVSNPKTTDSNTVQVKLSAKLKTLIVNKVDSTNDEPLKDVQFKLFDGDKEIAEKTTNEKGQAIFKNLPSDVEYTLKEVLPPKGYEAIGDVPIIFQDSDKYTLKLGNERKKGEVLLTKTNAQDDFVKIMDAEYTLFTSDGNEVETIATDVNGEANFEEIPWGNYCIQETKAPVGYALNETKHEFTVTKDNVDNQIKIYATDAQTETTRVTFNKFGMTTLGVQTDMPVMGATFKLYNVTNGRETPIGTYVTDWNGQIIVEDLVYGDYKFVETKAPAGYEITEPVEFNLSPDEPETEVFAYDKRKPGEIIVHKTDNLGNQVEGAVFELYDEDTDSLVAEATSGKNGLARFENLEWGYYYIKEKSAPECYQINPEEYSVAVHTSQTSQDIQVVNETKKGTVILLKTNEIGNVPLEGAEFNLYGNDGSLLQEGLVTDEDGQIRVENLEWGAYYFKETKAPAGYGMTDETIRFTVNSLNASIEQSIQVTNPLDSKSITMTKRIKADDINFDNGNPTFLFRVEGTDVNGKAHTYNRIVKFDENYVLANTDLDGFVSQSITASGLVAGEYTVTEEISARYTLESITGSENVTVNEFSAAVDLTTEQIGTVTFTNSKYEHADYSDTGSVANVLKKQAKLTGLKVTYSGETEVEANSEIDKSLISVTAIYDDGTTRELSDTEWYFGEGINNTFPNINGEYDIPVSYTEGGIEKTGYFTVSISGAIVEFIRLEAALKQWVSSEILPGETISPDWFDVYAINNLGERTKLYSAGVRNEPVIVTSPNWPSNYPNNMTETENSWEVEFPNASALKIVFSEDSKLESISYDWVMLYDSEESAISEKLGGTEIAGQEITVDGNYVKFTMTSNSSTTYKGFSATVYPLDEDGNVIEPVTVTESDYLVSPISAPDTEGLFKVNISLNPAVYEEDLTTSVNMTVEAPDPILETGTLFKAHIPDTATEVIFTDEKAPANVELTDVSAAQDESVVAWLEDATFKISTQRSGVKIIANSNSSDMFQDKRTLTNIDVAYLDTSAAKYLSRAFNNTGYDVSSFSIKGLHTWNTSSVTGMSMMFQDTGRNATTWNIGDLSGWNTSSVTSMLQMFYNAGRNATTFDIGDLSGWDTSACGNMAQMFYYAGYSATTFDIGDLSGWDTSSVTNMGSMFSSAGVTATWSLDLSGWNVPLVTSYTNFNKNTETKVTPPNWVN